MREHSPNLEFHWSSSHICDNSGVSCANRKACAVLPAPDLDLQLLKQVQSALSSSGVVGGWNGGGKTCKAWEGDRIGEAVLKPFPLT